MIDYVGTNAEFAEFLKIVIAVRINSQNEYKKKNTMTELSKITKTAMRDIKQAENYRRTQITESIQKDSGTQITESIHTFKEVEAAVESYLPNISKALKIALAVTTSGTNKNRVMLWLLLVGSPSSGKTDLVRLFKKCGDVYSLDNLTLNAFISGERSTEKAEVHDLLPKLNGKCLVVKDWTVVFSLDERMTKKIIGDMVGAYDKSLSKHSSRRGTITYDSEFSHLGCITPATLNRHQQYLNMIGPRFLHYIIPDLSKSDENKSFKAIFSDENRDEKEKIVAGIVSSYLNYLNTQDIRKIKPLSVQVQNYLKTASLFMAKARGIVITQAARFINEEGQEVSYYEPLDIQIEQPWRAVQQLILLSKYLALVINKNEVDTDECLIIKDIVLSSMPADRAQALKAIINSPEYIVTAKQLSESVEKSIKTARRLLDELAFLGILKKTKGSGQLASSYEIVDEFKTFISAHSGEFMSAYSNSEPQPPLPTLENDKTTPQKEDSLGFIEKPVYSDEDLLSKNLETEDGN